MRLQQRLAGGGLYLVVGMAWLSAGLIGFSPGKLCVGALVASGGLYKALLMPVVDKRTPGWVFRCFLLLQAGLLLGACVAFGTELIAKLEQEGRAGVEFVFGFVLLPLFGWIGLAGVVTAVASSGASRSVLWHVHRTPSRNELSLGGPRPSQCRSDESG